jgi:hypothetical protein
MSEMTDEQLNERLAIEGMGWYRDKDFSSFYCVDGALLNPEIWNPANDLNQVRTLEEEKISGAYEMLYLDKLDIVLAKEYGEVTMRKHIGNYYILHATARQKCDALLMMFREVRGE